MNLLYNTEWESPSQSEQQSVIKILKKLLLNSMEEKNKIGRGSFKIETRVLKTIDVKRKIFKNKEEQKILVDILTKFGCSNSEEKKYS